jgi:hypothetical protein
MVRPLSLFSPVYGYEEVATDETGSWNSETPHPLFTTPATTTHHQHPVPHSLDGNQDADESACEVAECEYEWGGQGGRGD